MFKAADTSLIGRKCRWTVWGVTYTGTIENVITDDTGPYRKGDWMVKVDGGGNANVIGCESKLF